jgi:hypothetical protein
LRPAPVTTNELVPRLLALHCSCEGAIIHIEVGTLDQMALRFSTRRPLAAELGMAFWLVYGRGCVFCGTSTVTEAGMPLLVCRSRTSTRATLRLSYFHVWATQRVVQCHWQCHANDRRIEVAGMGRFVRYLSPASSSQDCPCGLLDTCAGRTLSSRSQCDGACTGERPGCHGARSKKGLVISDAECRIWGCPQPRLV